MKFKLGKFGKSLLTGGLVLGKVAVVGVLLSDKTPSRSPLDDINLSPQADKRDEERLPKIFACMKYKTNAQCEKEIE